MTSATFQFASSSPAPNERRRTRPSSSARASGASRPRSRNQTVNVSACERHSSRPNWAIIARVSAVYPARTMNSVEGSPWLSASSSQMKNDEPDCGRPLRKAFRVLGRLPWRDAEPVHDPRADVVQRRERAEPLPDREEQRGNQRDADPPVHPQEERRHVGRARPADDALGHDPRPGEQADRAQPVSEPGRRQSGRPFLGGQLDADVTQDARTRMTGQR